MGEGGLVNVFLRASFDVFRQSSRFHFFPQVRVRFLCFFTAWNSWSHGNLWVHTVHTAHMNFVIKPCLWIWKGLECRDYEYYKAMNYMTMNMWSPWIPWLWICEAHKFHEFKTENKISMSMIMRNLTESHTAHMTFMNIIFRHIFAENSG